ncbi:MAG: putative selenium-dependent hydroxylase accessory protein YqeC [Spirochaetaceae bacterium]|nr:putative selenium-dependent hydroxylase accessory protein YqeC [Spirochaetaceae bacterium]
MSLYDLLWPHGPAVAVLIGGGGKTSLMARIAGEASRRGLPLLLSTTTRLQRPCPISAASLHVGSRPPDLYRPGNSSQDNSSLNNSSPGDSLPGDSTRVRPVLWVDTECAGGSKWSGPPLQALEAFLIESQQAGEPATVLIEADGSAGRPVKAPGPDEPVIPRYADTIAVITGLSALGRPVGEKMVHRLEPFLRATKASPGDIITPELLIRLIAHPEGSFKGARTGMRRLLILNQADTGEDVRQAVRIAESIISGDSAGSGKIETVAVTSLHNNIPIRGIISI